ncbi:MAG TPA: hypothetical protein HPP83_08105, partial [Candidatus Hydrogenedentes bacterium]|nr:hypothetical protein [Candidatus Hydrogenedentota bacterium]
EAPEYGEFTTAHFRLRGNRLELNLSADRTGGVQIEVRDEQFNAIPGRTFAEADSLYGDHLATPATWHRESDLSAYRDQIIYLRFRLRAAKLFAIKAAS